MSPTQPKQQFCISQHSDMTCRVTAMNVDVALLVHRSVVHEEKGFSMMRCFVSLKRAGILMYIHIMLFNCSRSCLNPKLLT